MSQDDSYRRHAAECRRRAEKTRNASDKAQWQTMAEHWLRLVRNNADKGSAFAEGEGTDEKNS